MATYFILIDGLRPDVVPDNCPNLAALFARGASTLSARSVMPSITLPCHTSIFHSVPPQRHGVTTNTFTPFARPLPGLIDVARAAGKRCGFFYNWEQLRDINKPGALFRSLFIDNVETESGDDEMCEVTVPLLLADPLDFCFIYYGTTDTWGHNFGWLSPEYRAQCTRVDKLVARIVATLPADGHVLVQADHGGHDRTHGTDQDADMLIPWGLAGPRVKPGYTLTEPVSLLDTAPTLAYILGLTPDLHWEGRVVREAFIN